MSKIEVDEIVNQSGDNDSGIDLTTNDQIGFKIANASKWTLNSSGNLFPASTAQGIVLGTTSDASANRLDDYEQGTSAATSVNGITASTNVVTGYYTKVGRLVVETMKVQISGKSGGSGNPWISLSFTPTNTVGTSVFQGGSIGMNTVITSSTFLNTGYMGVYGGNPSVYANDYQQSYYSSGSWSDGYLAFTVIYDCD